MSIDLTLVIPCFNEAERIVDCVQSLVAQIPQEWTWELLVVDGLSTDGTREAVRSITIDMPGVILVDNPARNKPSGLNIAIQRARGRVLMRADAHAIYGDGYVRTLVEHVRNDGIDNAGGIRRTHVPGGPAIATAIGVAVSHRLAIGDADYRATDIKAPKYVDTVFGGCYPTEVFQRIGLFNERLLRTQDREFNVRLLESGGRILLDPSVECTYFARTKFSRYLKWVYDGANWLFKARRLTQVNMVAWRNYVPALFCLYLFVLISTLLISSALNDSLITLIVGFSVPLLIYMALLMGAGIKEAWARGRGSLCWSLPLVIFATHLMYGVGTAVGLVTSLRPEK